MKKLRKKLLNLIEDSREREEKPETILKEIELAIKYDDFANINPNK